jgi:hypothetical protein
MLSCVVLPGQSRGILLSPRVEQSHNINNNPLAAFQWNIFTPLVTLQTLRISHDLLATYPEQSWIDLSKITHVFTNGGPTEMFGNVFTAMESLI